MHYATVRTFFLASVLILGNVVWTHAAEKIDWEARALLPVIQSKADAVIKKMTDEELAGAVIMPSFEKKVKPETFGKLLCALHARSYIILRSDTSKKLTADVQSAYTKACPKTGVILVVALDAEPSLMRYRMPTVKVGNTSELKTEALAVKAAQKIATALKSAGIMYSFAPVYDISWNREIISNRSFGGFEDLSSERADAFASATWELGVVPTAKHFPGHGMVTGDSHFVPVSIDASGGALPEEFQFVNAIGHGIPVMMIGHIIVKGGEWDTGGLPSTLSSKIMGELLREKLGFHGLIVTDSMAMGALKGYGDRTVKSLKAGADLVLIPPDPKAAYVRVLSVLKSDATFRARVKDAARRFQLIQLVREVPTGV